ncbi:MAG: hypothetical protein CME62_14820 [Halobacteriovoraceae bacterium]|nr:hypothetical protein [Halobacteriovoraceae bacterium]|tara:strand:+ start:4679 stop:5638 length:960 start_codon:yes stop_codon:yes gene_type:complete
MFTKALTLTACALAILPNLAGAVEIITNPTYPGTEIPVSFSYWNQENGVCKILGFERAIPKSTEFSDTDKKSIILGEDGSILEAKERNYVTQIFCEGVGNRSVETVVEIKEPTDPNSHIPLAFAYWSEEDGICKVHGYDRAVPKSSTFDGDERVLLVDAGGSYISSAERSRVTSTYCIGESSIYMSHIGYNNSNSNPYYRRLGFNFRSRALTVANDVISISKRIEQYLNNSQEVKIDALKSKAARLKAQIEGGRQLDIVLSTITELELLLSQSEGFISDMLETDRLDQMVLTLMTSQESLLTMIDFLKNDFKGQRQELY